MVTRAAIVMWWIGAVFFGLMVCAATVSFPAALLFGLLWLGCSAVTFILGGTFWRTPPLEGRPRDVSSDEPPVSHEPRGETAAPLPPTERPAPRRSRARAVLH
jgi:hypothetical protein